MCYTSTPLSPKTLFWPPQLNIITHFLLQDAAKSNDFEFFKSQLQLFSKICKVYTYILLQVCFEVHNQHVCVCTVSFEDNINCTTSLLTYLLSG